MAKESMKAKIARLEAENKDLTERLSKTLDMNMQLNNEIAEMQNATSLEIHQSEIQDLYEAESYLYDQINERNQEIKDLKAQISILKAEKEGVRPKTHNERNAGRKPTIDEKTIAMIKMYRAQGMTIKAIAELLGISYGSAQKHCSISKVNS